MNTHTYTKRELIEKIRTALTSARFAEWYTDGGRFDAWICADEDAPEDETIDEDIAVLFRL